MLRFVNSVDGPRLAALGTSCPDHFLRTKIKPLFVGLGSGDAATSRRSKPRSLERGWCSTARTTQAYYERCKRPDSPAMRDPNPTVVLIPGLGMIAWGKNKSESRVTAEFYNCAIEVMRGAEAIDRYEAMDQQEAFDIEYWPLEEAKLRRMPPEKELDRQVVVVIGAGRGIGKATAHRLVQEGAHVVCVDLDEAAAKATAQEIMRPLRRRDRRGRARASATAVPAIGLGCDITNRESVARMFDDVMLAYGGHRRRRRHRRHLRAARTSQRPHRRPPVGAHLRHQRHRRLHRRRRGAQDLQAAGPARQHRADHERQRGGGEEGKPGLRHEQGGGQSSGARAGGRDGAARARQRRGAGDGRQGQHDVPARPRDRVAGQVRDRRSSDDEIDRGAARQAGRVLRQALADADARSSPRIRPRRSSCWSRGGCRRRPATSSRSTADCRTASCAEGGGRCHDALRDRRRSHRRAEPQGQAAWLDEDYEHLGAASCGAAAWTSRTSSTSAQAFRVAVPSWGVGTGGTRFARFPGPGEPRDIYEKLEDCATIFKLVRSTPAVSLHIPWDKPDEPGRAAAASPTSAGLHFDAMNSNTFQDQADQKHSYKFGSLTHPDRGRARAGRRAQPRVHRDRPHARLEGAHGLDRRRREFSRARCTSAARSSATSRACARSTRRCPTTGASSSSTSSTSRPSTRR